MFIRDENAPNDEKVIVLPRNTRLDDLVKEVVEQIGTNRNKIHFTKCQFTYRYSFKFLRIVGAGRGGRGRLRTLTKLSSEHRFLDCGPFFWSTCRETLVVTSSGDF